MQQKEGQIARNNSEVMENEGTRQCDKFTLNSSVMKTIQTLPLQENKYPNPRKPQEKVI